jgi:hypothetical protein
MIGKSKSLICSGAANTADSFFEAAERLIFSNIAKLTLGCKRLIWAV